MTTRTVTGNIRSLTDSAVQTGTVTFEKIVTSTTGSTIHQSGVTTATTDSSGDFSIALAVPASGSYRYRMILPNGASFYFSIASGSSVNVATLIEAETITDQDAVVEALTAYLPLAGGTMTGALTLSGAPTVDLHAATKKYVDDNAGGGAVDSVFGRTGAVVAAPGDYSTDDISDDSDYAKANLTAVLNSIAQTDANQDIDIAGKQDADSDLTAIAALTPANDDVLQRKAGAWTNRTMAQLLTDLSAKLSAIDALTWAANSIILLTGTATASVQALAAHIVTLLQSATAADARTAIGAGTGNGDLLASNNLSELTATASTARTNLGLDTLATQAGTFSGGGTLATGGFTLTVPATGTAALLATANVFTANQTVSGANLTISGNGNLISRWITETASRVEIRQVQDVYNNVQFLGGASISTNAARLPILKALTVTQATDSIFSINDAVTNAIGNVVTLNHNSTGTPAAGLGAAVNFTLETSTTVDTQAGRMAVLWETVTHASRVPDMVAYLTDSAAEREIWRGRATGSAAAIGFLGAAPVARQAHIADASGDDAATVNAILDVLEAFGLVATS